MATGLPTLPTRLEPELRRVLAAILEKIEVGAGLGRGDPSQRYVTIEDLIGVDLVSLRNSYRNGPIGVGDLSSGGTTHSSAIPPKPTGFSVTAGFTFALITFDSPGYSNHAYTNIYRHTADNFAAASIVEVTTAIITANTINPGIQYYYWATHVSTSDIEGPPNATAGTAAEASIPPSYLLDQISDDVTSTPWYESLLEGIELVDDATGVVSNNLAQEVLDRTTEAEDLQSQITAISAATIAEVFRQATEPVDADAAGGTLLEKSLWYDTDDGNKQYRYLSGVWVDVSDQRILDNAASIVTEETARADADAAAALRLVALESTVDDPSTGVSANAAAISSVSAAVVTQGDAIVANASSIGVLESSLSDAEDDIIANAASIDSVSTTVSGQGDDITANASSLATLQAIVGSDYAIIQEVKDVVVGPTGLAAQWEIKTNVNNLQGGVGFYNDGVDTYFLINAGVFGVVNDDGNTVQPLIVSGGITYLNAAVIEDASISSAKIIDLVVEKLTGLDVAFLNATFGNGWVNNLMIGDTIQSDGYATNAEGWRMHKTAGFTVRGPGGVILFHQPISGAATLGEGIDNAQQTYDALAGTKPPIDADNTADNTGDMAHIDQLTIANRATYMQAAIIGEAFIEDLAVKTFHIGDQQVTIPFQIVNDVRSSMLYADWTPCVSDSFTSSGAPVAIWMSISGSKGASGASDNYIVRLRRRLDAGSWVVLFEELAWNIGTNAINYIFTHPLQDTPGAGEAEYELTCFGYDANNFHEYSSLVAIETIK